MFDRTAFDSHLRTREFGQSFTYISSCPSTNDVALLLAQSNAPTGTLVFTDHQTAGRGRDGSTWFAVPESGLTFSLIIRDLTPDQVSRLSMVAGTAMVSALRPLGANLKLKWPNDLQISGKKTGGILCESRWEGNQCRFTVVGIGLNVNESPDQFPPDLKSNVTSLSIAIGKPLNREKILGFILNQFEKDVILLRDSQTDVLQTRWVKACAHLNSQVEIRTANSKVTGTFQGIDSQGRAVLQTSRGKKSLNSGSLLIL
ncbi:MAG: biotin--[acetyl-CoA-carboxylase] ligase [FCB group bacterium]|nr:biotin--[acetyl-CoA-carboxylase] ligase [FCB group bacterium]